MNCGICDKPFKDLLEQQMAPKGPDGNPAHYSCLAEITNMQEDTPPKKEPDAEEWKDSNGGEIGGEGWEKEGEDWKKG